MNTQDYSTLDREQKLYLLSQGIYDVIIIGGGISGAGIALDAVSRGLKTALVEMQDFGSGTSGRSTKLIHGGLRYLEHFNVKLVHQVGHERDVLFKNAQHLVIPQSILLPIVKKGKLKTLTVKMALWLYDLLAGVHKAERHKILSRETAIKLEPLLNRDILLGGALYYEYRTSDSRLVIEILKTASERGAVLLNYCKSEQYLSENGKITGIEIRDLLKGNSFPVFGHSVINATGPWTDEQRKMNDLKTSSKIVLSKGIHLVVSRHLFPIRQPVYFDTFDQRMIFAIPRDHKVYIGTTDTFYHGDLTNPIVFDDEINYLLNAVKNIFPGVNITPVDIESTWAGLRPLIYKTARKATELSRKDEVFIDPGGLISIAGGKLTAYRLMAKKVIDLVMGKLKKDQKRIWVECKTRDLKISGSIFIFPSNISSPAEFCDYKYGQAKQTGIDPVYFKKLFNRYGSNLDIITEKAYELHGTAPWQLTWIQAEIEYAFTREMCVNLSDFLIRRTEAIFFEPEFVRQYLPDIARIFGQYMKWPVSENELQESLFKKEAELFYRFRW